MPFSKYLRVVRQRQGHAWYENEVHPRIVSDILGQQIRGRSYLMAGEDYRRWIDATGMDMFYGYLPWNPGRPFNIDDWGRKIYGPGQMNIGDDFQGLPEKNLRERIEELLLVHGDAGIEWAVYSTPNIVMNALGFEKFFLATKDCAPVLLDWMLRVDDEVQRQLQIVLSYPVDVVQLSTYLADKNGGFFSPEDTEIFILAFLEPHAQAIHDSGRLFSLHCDGECSKFYPRMKEIGVDVLNAYDGKDILFDMKRWGKPFRGSVSQRILEQRDEWSVKCMTQAAIACLPSHIIASTHDCGAVSTENFKAMMEIARDAP